MMPVVSVILPIRNEENNIKNTIDSILNQSYDLSRVQIIVVDGMSDDSTRNILKEYGFKIETYDNPHKYMPMAFNIGLSESKGSIIIVMGGHCTFDKNYINNCVNNLINNDYTCVGGIIENEITNSKQEAISIALSSLFGVGGVNFRMESNMARLVDTVAFGAYKREIFLKIGSLDEELIKNQDDEFNFRLLQSGGTIWLDPAIVSYYKPRSSLKKLFSQYFNYGLYKVRVIQKRKGIPALRHLVPGSFFITLSFSLIYGLLFKSFMLFKIIISIYILVNFFFSILSGRKKQKTILLLPLIYFILHLSYGMGFVFGLAYFRKKWKDIKIINNNFNVQQFKSVQIL